MVSREQWLAASEAGGANPKGGRIAERKRVKSPALHGGTATGGALRARGPGAGEMSFLVNREPALERVSLREGGDREERCKRRAGGLRVGKIGVAGVQPYREPQQVLGV
jgi:hypothetical protein